MTEPIDPKGPAEMARKRRKQALTLLTTIVVVVAVAQIGGVGGTTSKDASHAAVGTRLASVPGGSAPGATSTQLASTSITAARGETIRIHTTAHARSASRALTQVVCGIVYGRAHDAAWTLGTPTETLTLKRSGAADAVTIDRTLIAPADDTYTASSRCHVATPEAGAHVTATGTASMASGLPAGAAQPVR